MKHDAFQYSFTPKEMAYLLFKKKLCPKCGGNMTRSKGYETVAGSELNTSGDAFFVPSARVRNYVFYYTCSICNTKYTLKELSE